MSPRQNKREAPTLFTNVLLKLYDIVKSQADVRKTVCQIFWNTAKGRINHLWKGEIIDVSYV